MLINNNYYKYYDLLSSITFEDKIKYDENIINNKLNFFTIEINKINISLNKLYKNNLINNNIILLYNIIDNNIFYNTYDKIKNVMLINIYNISWKLFDKIFNDLFKIYNFYNNIYIYKYLSSHLFKEQILKLIIYIINLYKTKKIENILNNIKNKLCIFNQSIELYNNLNSNLSNKIYNITKKDLINMIFNQNDNIFLFIDF